MLTSKVKAALMILAIMLVSPACLADNRITLDAIDEVMFDYDTIGYEFVNYKVVSEGNVSLTVDESVPDDLYVELIQRLRAHKDIRSVLAGRDNVCGTAFVAGHNRWTD